MGTQKGSKAKKATNAAAKKKKLSTKVKIVDPVSGPVWPCRNAKGWEEWEDNIILGLREEGKTYMQIGQRLSPRTSDACRDRYLALEARTQKENKEQPNFVKDWEDWEDDIILDLRKEGKSHAQISQHLSHRSERACRGRFGVLKARSQEVRTQKIDVRVSSTPKRPRFAKGWEDWEDQILVAHRTAGWPFQKIQRLLPHRSQESVYQRARRKGLSETSTPGDRQPSNTTSEDIVHSGAEKLAGPWTQEEDQTLRSLRELGFSFQEIAEKFGNRSPDACKNRWLRIRQDQGPRKIGAHYWTEWEQRHIVSGYYAGLSWEEISKSMTGRTLDACAAQWSHLFRMTDPDEAWTAEDLALLVDLRSQGSSWKDISKRFPQYSINACRTHWYKETEGIPGPLFRRRFRNLWSAGEVKTLVSLYNTIGPRYEKICKHLPGRSAAACINYLHERCTEEDGVGGPPSEFWKEYFASKLHADRSEYTL